MHCARLKLGPSIAAVLLAKCGEEQRMKRPFLEGYIGTHMAPSYHDPLDPPSDVHYIDMLLCFSNFCRFAVHAFCESQILAPTASSSSPHS